MIYRKGQKIKDRFEVFHVDQTGGMGIVYICYDEQWKIPVALKTLREEFLTEKATIDRFRQEAEVWKRIDKHINIVQAYYVEDIDYRPYILLEWVPSDDNYGPNLMGWIANRGLNTKRILDFSIQICHGLMHTEDKFNVMGMEFVHRDLKPTNIMVALGKIAKVTDFGLVKCYSMIMEGSENSDSHGEGKMKELGLSRRGITPGTPAYMSPEQWSDGKILDCRSDIYAMGCVMYEMVCGCPPFTYLPKVSPEDQAYFIGLKHMEQDPPKPRSIYDDCPDSLKSLILKCLAKNPAERFSSVNDLQNDLSDIYQEYTGSSFSKSYTPTPPSDQELTTKAYAFNNLGRHDEALQICEDVLARDPQNTKAWFAKGNACGFMGRMEEAIESFKKALEIDPEDPDTLANVGCILLRQGNYPGGMACVEKALAIDRKHLIALKLKATMLQNTGRYKEAIDLYDFIIEINPVDPEVWVNKGTALVEIGHNEEAIVCCDRAIEMKAFPQMGGAYKTKGKALANMGRYDEADSLYDEALAIKPDMAEVWFNKGVLCGIAKEYEKSIDCYNKALEIDPRLEVAHYWKGKSLQLLERHEESIPYYEAAIELNSRNRPAMHGKMEALERTGKYRDAMLFGIDVFKRYPEDARTLFLLGFCLYNIGLSKQDSGALERARECFQSSIAYASNEYPVPVEQIKTFISDIERELEQQ